MMNARPALRLTWRKNSRSRRAEDHRKGSRNDRFYARWTDIEKRLLEPPAREDLRRGFTPTRNA